MANLKKYTSSEIENFRKQFDVFDLDKSGKISHKELKTVMDKLGMNLTDAQIKSVIKTFDSSGDGELDFSEYVMLLVATGKDKAPAEANDDTLGALFKAFDSNGDGKITVKEFCAGIGFFGSTISEADAKKLIAKFDTNSDGQLDKTEFTKLAKECLAAAKK